MTAWPAICAAMASAYPPTGEAEAIAFNRWRSSGRRPGRAGRAGQGRGPGRAAGDHQAEATDALAELVELVKAEDQAEPPATTRPRRQREAQSNAMKPRGKTMDAREQLELLLAWHRQQLVLAQRNCEAMEEMIAHLNDRLQQLDRQDLADRPDGKRMHL